MKKTPSSGKSQSYKYLFNFNFNLIVTQVGWVGSGCLFVCDWEREGVEWGGRFFEAGRLLTFSAFGMSAYSR